MGDVVKNSTVDICITSPPYWDILSGKRSADYKAVRDYSEGDGDIAAGVPAKSFQAALAAKQIGTVSRVLFSPGSVHISGLLGRIQAIRR